MTGAAVTSDLSGWSASCRVSSWLRCAEPAADPISEAELARIWQEQRFPHGALLSAGGDAVEVVFPGRRGGGAGPDFRDAVVRLGGVERYGDVELHIRASYFRGHGHHLDPAYDALALHVVYLADDGKTTRLSNGACAPVAAFAPWVEQRSADLQHWLEGPALWREPCAGAVARLGEAPVRAVLAAAGGERLQARVAALRAQVAALGEEETLWRALLECLGYGGDREGFRRLALRFPAGLARGLLLDPAAGDALLEAALLAVAGLAPPPPAMRVQLPAVLTPPLAGRRGRPANRPEARLRALAGLVARAGGDLTNYACVTVAAAVKPRDLLAGWQVRGLLGPERAAEIALNAVLPFAATRPELAPAALALAAELPLQRPYGKTAFLEANLRRVDGRRLAGSALEQQGLLGLLDAWCRQGGCGRCPLS